MSALIEREKVFVSCAALAAQSAEGPFRPRDLRFYLELFSNWVEVCLKGDVLQIQNTQLIRFLDDRCKANEAKRVRKERISHYQLTRSGVLSLLSAVVMHSYVNERERFFFVFYFLLNYHEQLRSLATKSIESFPSGIQIEFEELLSPAALLEREMNNTESELKKLDARIDATKATHKMSLELVAEGMPLFEVIAKVEEAYPYEFHSVRPLRELLAKFEPEQAQWELIDGNKARLLQIFTPSRALLRQYLDLLQALAREL